MGTFKSHESIRTANAIIRFFEKEKQCLEDIMEHKTWVASPSLEAVLIYHTTSVRSTLEQKKWFRDVLGQKFLTAPH